MRCIKCKKEIADDVLRCEYCNTKVQTVCPVCKTKNLITTEYCQGCGLQLIKYCPACNKVNRPDAKICRKCGHEFEELDEDMITITALLSEKVDDSAHDILTAQNNPSHTEAESVDAVDAVNAVDTVDRESVQQDEHSNENLLLDLSDQVEQIEELPLSEGYTDVVELEPFDDKEVEPDVVTDEGDAQIDIIDETSSVAENQSDVEIQTEENSQLETKSQAEIAIQAPDTEPDSQVDCEPAVDDGSFDLSSLADENSEEVAAVEQSFSDTVKSVDEVDKTKHSDSAKEQNKTDSEKITGSSNGDESKKNLQPSLPQSKEKVVPAMELQMNDGDKQDVSKTKIPAKANDTKVISEKDTEVENGADDTGDDDSPVDKAINISTNDQSKCKNVMAEAIRSDDKLIIGLSGEEGHGKSTILKYLFNDLINQNYNWLWGECSANTQISPFGIFQEMLLTFFNCPNYTTMSQEFQLSVETAFKNYFTSFNRQDVTNLFNFLYPTLNAHFEDILINKEVTFNLLEKTLLEISKKSKLIITIDDFDMIDGASYEFLVRFIENENLSPNLKLVISYKDKRIAQGYFYSEKIKENQYQDIHLGKLDNEYIDKLVKLYLNGFNPLPEELFKEICTNSKGSSAYVEQVLILLNENEAFYPEDNEIKYRSTPIELELPKTIFDVITHRLEQLKKNFPMVYKTLCTAAIMGNKFNVQLLEQIMKLNSADFQNILKLLTNSAYITQFNNSLFVFKNTLLWKIIYEKSKQNKDFVTLNERIFDVINTVTLSSNAIKALIAQNLNQKLLALNIWTENTKLCSYLGDEHLWTLSQKQSLKIVQEVTPQNNRIIINNIYERLGKLLYSSKPTEAVEYISYALNQAIKVSNIPKTIELSGYLMKSCSIIGNYYGVIEAVDTILKLIDNPEYKLEAALIKYKKLKALFSIGNSEEIYNLASNEIIPVIEQAISKLIPIKNIPMEIIYETWLETNLIVANALSIQGNNKCFQVLSFIDEIISKNNVDNKNYLNRVALAKALAYSIQGDIKKSEDLLIDISQKTANEIVEPEIISQWNFINILNKLYKRDWANIKEDMYSVVTFANNYNDVLVKNLLKIFLGKVLQEEGNLAKALDIYNEQVTLFAKEKIAIGALLCWYYIAKITLVTDGSDKALDIAQKALEVSKNPKIFNYYFMVMYKKLIAEIFIIKGDLEAAKMYIEKALLIVKNYDMKLHKIMLYQLYAKYLEEMVLRKPKNKNVYAHNAISTYKKAIVMVKELNMPAIEEELQKNFSSFRAFCQLNAIKL